jgi:hypothetical protein
VPVSPARPWSKHKRPIALQDWQQEIVDTYSGIVVRWLIRSGGCRVTNWARRPVGGELKRYE